MQFKSLVILSLSLGAMAGPILQDRHAEHSGSVAAVDKREELYRIIIAGEDDAAVDKRDELYRIIIADKDDAAVDKREEMYRIIIAEKDDAAATN